MITILNVSIRLNLSIDDCKHIMMNGQPGVFSRAIGVGEKASGVGIPIIGKVEDEIVFAGFGNGIMQEGVLFPRAGDELERWRG